MATENRLPGLLYLPLVEVLPCHGIVRCGLIQASNALDSGHSCRLSQDIALIAKHLQADRAGAAGKKAVSVPCACKSCVLWAFISAGIEQNIRWYRLTRTVYPIDPPRSS